MFDMDLNSYTKECECCGDVTTDFDYCIECGRHYCLNCGIVGYLTCYECDNKEKEGK